MNESIEKVIQALENENIAYEIVFHEKVSAMEELESIGLTQNCDFGKNLFVHNRSGKEHFLIVVREDKQADLKSLARAIGSSRLEFAKEDELMRFLGVGYGAVSLSGVINDKEHSVTVVIDNDIINSQRFGMQPNDNTASVFLKMSDVIKLVENCGSRIIYADI